MNKFEAQECFVQRIMDSYPPGTRLVLLSMDDPYAPIPSGTRGTVEHKKRQGTVLCLTIYVNLSYFE